MWHSFVCSMTTFEQIAEQVCLLLLAESNSTLVSRLKRNIDYLICKSILGLKIYIGMLLFPYCLCTSVALPLEHCFYIYFPFSYCSNCVIHLPNWIQLPFLIAFNITCNTLSSIFGLFF